jgi:FdhE protein
MNDVLEEIIREKPHLADPLRFYKKILAFIESVRSLLPSPKPHQTAYGPDVIDGICKSFSSALDLPEGALDPLKQALELREIDFTRLPLGEVPAFSLPYSEDDLAVMLYLLSKPYFLSLSEAYRLDGRAWEEGKCPVCNAQPAIVWMENSQRHAACSFCRTTGCISRSGCPICLSQDTTRQGTLAFEGEEGFVIGTCDLCRSYVKTIERRLIPQGSPEIADLMSLPLDIVVQEKGYMRRSPNPIGMKKITMQG